MPASTRHDRDIEERSPLLSPASETPTLPAPAWQFWRHPPFIKSERLVDGEEDDEDLAVLRAGSKSERRWFSWEQVGLYLALVLVGALVGVALSRVWSRRGGQGSKGREPMVPPVWELPPPTGLPRNPAYLINATTAAVASEDLTCSNLGVSILRDKNGTAVDAAITTALCVGLLNAFASGIGGGGFMTIRIPPAFDHARVGEKEWRELGDAGIWAIDFRETSPAGSEKAMYGVEKAGRMAAQVGGLAIGVPGELRGLEAAHKMYGTLPWKEVVMPVAELARGWRVSRELARRLRYFGGFMLESPVWQSIYAPQGYLAVEGDWIKRERYGRTLERIANEGVSAFYEGDVAKEMVKTIKANGGIMTVEDLRNYEARLYPAVHQTYHNKTIYTTSAPSSGGIMLGMLNILEPYDLHEHGCLNTSLNTHILLEAMKFAFGARSEVTDPPFGNASRFDEFYSKEWADGIRPLVTPNQTHDFGYYGLQHDTPIDHGTMHLSAVDKWGGAASLTSTVNLIWGSHVMCPATGVIFNDEQDDFAVPGAADAFGLWPSPWNYPAPNKRPLSSTAPTIILDERQELYAVLGGSGGSRIFPSVAQVLLNLECGMDISAAIEKERVHNQIVPPLTTVEVGPGGEDVGLRKGLEARGHKVGVFDINLGIAEVQGIVLEGGRVYAASDSRKNGIAAGY